MSKGRDIAILGVVRHGKQDNTSVSVAESRPWTDADDEEENRIMREDG